MSKENNNRAALTVCGTCNGTGRIAGSMCRSCHGLGVGLVLDKSFYYFSLPISITSIYLRRLRQAVFFAMDSLIGLAAVSGVLSLAYWFYQRVSVMSSPRDLYFWQDKSPWVLFFWAGVLLILFLGFRFSRRQEIFKKIKDSDWLEYINWNENVEWQLAWQGKSHVNIAGYLSEDLLNSLEKAYLKTAGLGQDEIRPTHLMSAFLSEKTQVSAWFSRLQLNLPDLVAKLGRQVKSLQTSQATPDFSRGLRLSSLIAYAIGLAERRNAVESMDMLVSLNDNDPLLSEVFYDEGIDRDKLINLSEWHSVNLRIAENIKTFRHLARFKPSGTMDRAYTAMATPILDGTGYDLTTAAKFNRLEICVNREAEMAQIITALSSGQPGIVLVGPEGAGKKTVVGGLAQMMVMEKVPGAFQDKRLVEIDVARLVGGLAPAQAEQRMMSVMDEVAQAGNVIVHIPDIESILGLSAGGASTLDLSEIVANGLSRGWLYCVASCTDENYNKYVQNSPLGKIMLRVDIDEPEVNQAIQMLESRVAAIERRYGIYLSYESLSQAVRLSIKFIHDANLPDKALRLLDTTAAKVAGVRGARSMMTGDDISDTISTQTGVPVGKLGADEGKELLALEDKMHERMIGQDEAVKAVSAALRRARAELREGKRPIASFLFLGPTGVGKTELAKTLAEVYFGDEKNMIRLDMSEYQAADAVEKMIGSAEGVLGYLTERVRELPFSLILLDEIEKANPRVLDLFLQVMDDGRLTDGQGRTVDFTNSIIIATSNIGALAIRDAVEHGKDLDKIKSLLIDAELVKAMRPEFINRFDGIIVFKPLSISDVTSIANLMIKKLARILDAKGIALEASAAGLSRLADLGYEPEFGARPLRRVLQDRVENVIANKILAGEVKRRDRVVLDERAEIQVVKAKDL